MVNEVPKGWTLTPVDHDPFGEVFSPIHIGVDPSVDDLVGQQLASARWNSARSSRVGDDSPHVGDWLDPYVVARIPKAADAGDGLTWMRGRVGGNLFGESEPVPGGSSYERYLLGPPTRSQNGAPVRYAIGSVIVHSPFGVDKNLPVADWRKAMANWLSSAGKVHAIGYKASWEGMGDEHPLQGLGLGYGAKIPYDEHNPESVAIHIASKGDVRYDAHSVQDAEQKLLDWFWKASPETRASYGVKEAPKAGKSMGPGQRVGSSDIPLDLQVARPKLMIGNALNQFNQ